MSEQALKDALEKALTEDNAPPAEPEKEPQNEPVQEPEEKEEKQTEAPKLSKTQQDAHDKGWRPKDDFEGDLDNWIPAGTFLRIHTLQKDLSDSKSQFQQQLNKQEKDFTERAKLLNDSHRKELELKRNAAVEEGDMDAFKANQEQIDALNKQQVDTPKPQNAIDPALQSWIDDKPWLNTDTPKRDFADATLTDFASKYPNSTMPQALKHVDEQLEKHFPKMQPINPRRDAPQIAESGSSRAGGVKKTSKLSWGDLTREEEQFFGVAGGLFVDKKTGKPSKDVYLKVVADKRI